MTVIEFRPRRGPGQHPDDVSPSGLWWLSFVDPSTSAPLDQQRPGGSGFLGACIVHGPTFIEAVKNSHLIGCNPGGALMAIPTNRPPHRLWIGRLLTAADIDHLEATEAGLTAGQTANYLGRELWTRKYG
ncbi:hypothetical protein [Nocardia miyunensis]|uniref:hypothetical protein n=1 Tax=Nocardia miyunensis TaxID=282684 RepID=UPI000835CC11|nr:hypothetical protein [Nocardia miyunensis]